MLISSTNVSSVMLEAKIFEILKPNKIVRELMKKKRKKRTKSNAITQQ